jgi:hypothetical protein
MEQHTGIIQESQLPTQRNILIFGVGKDMNIGKATYHRFASLERVYNVKVHAIGRGDAYPTVSDVSCIVNCIGLFGEGNTISRLIRTNALMLNDILTLYENVMETGAKVFNITSSAGVRFNPEYPRYSLSKQVAEMVTKQLADEYIKKRIFINSVAIARTKTKMRAKINPDYLKEHSFSPEDVAQFIFQLYMLNLLLYGNTFDLKLLGDVRNE